ncbi:LacI family DNA-binding transcriptional regulator [Gryllotalpicola daejeonensis]|uniref:LacI family DNA-binding transcriptional regulator n=1 Tax=Gryllotalpicola daejeonensis TaxID=993087 RepID=UPI0031DE5E3B
MSFVRLTDVAARAGVSPGTVSNFFHNPSRVAELTAERIRAAIDDLGYVPNDAARALRRRETKLIGHLAFEVANPYSAEFVRAFDREARALGYTVLNVSSEGDHELQRTLIETFVRQRVDGVLLTPTGGVGETVDVLKGHGVPVVLTDNLDGAAPAVAYDDRLTGRLAAEHLVNLGRRKIAFVGNRDGVEIIARRLQGVRDVLAGVPDSSLEVVDLETRSVASGRVAAQRLAALTPDRIPDGIVAVNDPVGIGLLNVLSHRVRVPEDVAIVGIDDIEFAAEAVVPLTSVARPIDDFAAQSLRLLHSQIHGDATGGERSLVVLEPRLIVRESTVPGTAT